MFKPVKSHKVYQQVVEQVQQMLLEGTLQKGDRLPSEREMSERFEVSRASIREALRALEIIGIIECRQGGGSYVRSAFSRHGFEPLSVMFRLNNGTFRDILEYRMLFEPEAAAMAARRISEEESAELLALAAALQKADNEDDSVRIDLQIHAKITELCGNFLIQSTMIAISQIMRSFIRDARDQLHQWRNNHAQLTNLHVALCKAIAARDPQKAQAASKKHFQLILDNR